ncbi:SMI1/KNR4 family protein [Kineococcus arenarius]|uniref:SMI1/KNR4 family protein n=1 Tax=unclassified Kineococcus TaxID=2621656 RepID=UPI003D7D0656
MSTEHLQLPEPLAAAHRLGFHHGDGGGQGVDHDPFESFWSAQETAGWIRNWTGNPHLEGREFRMFGEEGSGGVVGFWMVRGGVPVEAQPVAFFGSEGERVVLARDLASFLWLLADDIGPWDAALFADPDLDHDSDLEQEEEPWSRADIAEVARRYAPDAARTARQIVLEAQAEFPEFGDLVQGWCDCSPPPQ